MPQSLKKIPGDHGCTARVPELLIYLPRYLNFQAYVATTELSPRFVHFSRSVKAHPFLKKSWLKHWAGITQDAGTETWILTGPLDPPRIT